MFRTGSTMFLQAIPGLQQVGTNPSFRNIVGSRVLRNATLAVAACLLAKGLNQALNGMALNNVGFLVRKSSWDWGKEIVVVTGGSSGIGELMARKLAKRNIKVVVLDLRPPKDPFPTDVWFYQADVTSPDAIHQVADAIRRDVGAPTVLINNAGFGTFQSILDETEQDIRRTFDVNVISHFFLIKEFLPSMISQDHGHVVTIASMASFVVLASNVDYSCTKVATLAFHEGLSQELKYRYNAPGVRTSIVHPTWIRTPLLESILARGRFGDTLLDPEKVTDVIVAHVLKGESGQLFLPAWHSLASGIRGFPTWIQEGLRGARRNVLAS